MTDQPTFYTPVWGYKGFQLVTRPDTGNYYIAWCPAGSGRVRRRSTRSSDLDEARERLVEFASRRTPAVSTHPSDVELLECLLAYTVPKTKASPRTWPAERTAEKHWRAFIRHEGLTRVADLTVGMQELYVDWRRERLLLKGFAASNATIKRELGVMRSALREAWKRGQLERPPYVMSLPTVRPRDRVLTPEEHAALLDASVEPHLHLFVMLATHTLQRPGAIFDLRVEQVDLERGIIDFHRPGDYETNKRRAVVPISSTLRPHLEQGMMDSLSGYLVEWMGAPITNVRRSFATACTHAGIEGATPYVLRRSGATLLAAAGVPMRQIAGMLGHTTTHTTEYHYAKHAPSYLSHARDELDRIFGSKSLGTGPAESDGPRLRLIKS